MPLRFLLVVLVFGFGVALSASADPAAELQERNDRLAEIRASAARRAASASAAERAPARSVQRDVRLVPPPRDSRRIESNRETKSP